VALADSAAELFQEHRDELGFVNRAQCREKDLLTAKRDGRVVGALLGNHCVRKPQSTIYELAVRENARRHGIGRALVERFAAESPHDTLVAKCPVDLPANRFYDATGWERVSVDDGKNRELVVWERDISDRTPVYMTVHKSRDVTEAIDTSAAYLGVESSHDWFDGYTPDFLDYPFTDPDATFDNHLQTVRQVEPKLTVAPDVEKGRALADVIPLADELLAHADTVVVVPKECHPSDIPDRFRVGVPVGDFGSQAPWSVWDYRDCGAVHILGGPPGTQREIGRHLPVASLDTATLGQRCRFGMWDGKAIDAPEGWDYRDRLTHSLDCYVAAWN